MADEKTVQTPAGTILPLVNLKGKQYLMVAYRMQWLNEIYKKFDIKTEYLLLTDDQTICKSTVTLMDDSGVVVKSAQATKRETKKDFPDHTEKAETAAIGRALAMMGFGTQFALSDLDEGQRLADSPLAPAPKAEAKPAEKSPVVNNPAPAKTGFTKKTTAVVKPTVVTNSKPVEAPKPAVQQLAADADAWQ
jgi:hypothetical protein